MIGRVGWPLQPLAPYMGRTICCFKSVKKKCLCFNTLWPLRSICIFFRICGSIEFIRVGLYHETLDLDVKDEKVMYQSGYCINDS